VEKKKYMCPDISFVSIRPHSQKRKERQGFSANSQRKEAGKEDQHPLEIEIVMSKCDGKRSLRAEIETGLGKDRGRSQRENEA